MKERLAFGKLGTTPVILYTVPKGKKVELTSVFVSNSDTEHRLVSFELILDTNTIMLVKNSQLGSNYRGEFINNSIVLDEQDKLIGSCSANNVVYYIITGELEKK